MFPRTARERVFQAVAETHAGATPNARLDGRRSDTLTDAGITAETARDTYAALCNIGVYRVLTEERGWDADRVERWWNESLVRLLLADD